jgi:deoxyribodipyrimidine photo-lyase
MSSVKYENGLFIFRRDFRVIDNNGLNMANSICKNIYPIFIFTPEQVTDENKFKSSNAVQFMIESLQDLSEQIKKMGTKDKCKLLCFYGDNESIISYLIIALNIHIVCFNADYTPYAIKREQDIISLCNSYNNIHSNNGVNVDVVYEHDYYLHTPGSVLNGSGNIYQKFTPYYNTAMKIPIKPPAGLKKICFVSPSSELKHTISLDDAMKRFVGNINDEILVSGGRKNAMKQIQFFNASNISNHYSKTRNNVFQSTSQLSAYIKFGCVSIREVYQIFKTNHDFIRQLIWRDFYATILYAFPHVLGSSMKLNYNKIKWNHNSVWFKKWCDGNTGFPIVDAGMKQLNQTGYMHNRARLIVMFFLIKTLCLDWRLGEKYFATKLTDYDPASNNGNIQWVMGGGSDSNPFFRIFNMWRQTEEHDANCEYIKKWIPELREVPVKDILHWDTEWMKYKDGGYPKPMVDYLVQKEIVLKLYKTALY